MFCVSGDKDSDAGRNVMRLAVDRHNTRPREAKVELGRRMAMQVQDTMGLKRRDAKDQTSRGCIFACMQLCTLSGWLAGWPASSAEKLRGCRLLNRSNEFNQIECRCIYQ